MKKIFNKEYSLLELLLAILFFMLTWLSFRSNKQLFLKKCHIKKYICIYHPTHKMYFTSPSSPHPYSLNIKNINSSWVTIQIPLVCVMWVWLYKTKSNRFFVKNIYTNNKLRGEGHIKFEYIWLKSPSDNFIVKHMNQYNTKLKMQFYPSWRLPTFFHNYLFTPINILYL